jgi:hypothetical protein
VATRRRPDDAKLSAAVLGRNLDFFRALYEAEQSRATRLSQLATAYFGIEGLYIGAVAFKFADVAATATSSGVPVTVFLAALGLMLLALALTASAVAVRVTEGLEEPLTLAKRLEEAPQDEADFLFDRCMDYAVAADRNSAVIDKRANRLQIAGWAIFGAIFVHGLGVAWALAKSLGVL